MPSDSQCLLCSRFFYDEEHEHCPRCGGLCAKYPSDNLRYMERRTVISLAPAAAKATIAGLSA